MCCPKFLQRALAPFSHALGLKAKRLEMRTSSWRVPVECGGTDASPDGDWGEQRKQAVEQRERVTSLQPHLPSLPAPHTPQGKRPLEPPRSSGRLVARPRVGGALSSGESEGEQGSEMEGIEERGNHSGREVGDSSSGNLVC